MALFLWSKQNWKTELQQTISLAYKGSLKSLHFCVPKGKFHGKKQDSEEPIKSEIEEPIKSDIEAWFKLNVLVQRNIESLKNNISSAT